MVKKKLIINRLITDRFLVIFSLLFLSLIWKSLFADVGRKICHYQQNESQHYYLLDTLEMYHTVTIDWPCDCAKVPKHASNMILGINLRIVNGRGGRVVKALDC